MAKKKTVVQPIGPAGTRRSTFKKRKATLFQKALELSTLCDVEVCMLVSEGPDDPNPAIWPDEANAMRILLHFGAMPDADKSKRMVTRESFLLQQMEKMQVQLQKLQSENCKLETGVLLHEVLSGQSRVTDVMSIDVLAALGLLVEKRLSDVSKRVHDLAPSPALPLRGVNTWCPSAVQSDDPLIGFHADMALGQGLSTTGMEKDWQDESECVLGPTSSDVAPPQVEDENEMDFDFLSYGFDEEMRAILFS